MIRRNRREAGVTLIEMMVVVVIIALFAALVLPKMIGQAERGKRVAARAQINAYMTALGSYKLDTGVYPTTEQGLQALVTQPNDPTITNYRAGGYLSSLPKDPWNNPYQYASPGANGRDYEITSYGRDGKPGGEGYDADISTSTLEQR